MNKVQVKKQVVINGLVRARKFLQKGWTRKWFARDAKGNDCDSSSRKAVCWCALGALGKAFGQNFKPYDAASTELERTIGGSNVPNWNDDPSRTQGQVVSAFTRTIARLRRLKAVELSVDS